MSFAKSGSSNIWNKKKWQKRAEVKEEPCRHLVMKGMDGIMVCQKCGFQRLPYDWEDDGRYYAKEDVDQPAPRMEGTGTNF